MLQATRSGVQFLLHGADSLTSHVHTVLKSRSFNLLEPSGSVQGLLRPFFIINPQGSHLSLLLYSPGSMGFKQLYPNVPQNLVHDAECPRFSQVLKKSTFLTTCMNSLTFLQWDRSRTAINQPLRKQKRMGRGRCVD